MWGMTPENKNTLVRLHISSITNISAESADHTDAKILNILVGTYNYYDAYTIRQLRHKTLMSDGKDLTD